MLPSPQREQIKNYLAEYLELRIEKVSADVDESIKTIERTEKLQDAIWAAGITGTELASESFPRELFMKTLTRLVSVHNKRGTVGLFQRMPLIF